MLNELKVSIVKFNSTTKYLYSLYKRLFFVLDSIGRPKKINNFDTIIYKFIQENKDVSFIQIGANNGVTNHDFFQKLIEVANQIILIEPVPNLFHDLFKNYRNVSSKIIFENIAISDCNGKKNFYSIDADINPEKYPQWLIGLGSFNKETILKHRSSIKDLESLIKEIEVPVLTFESIVKKYFIDKVDVLQIDTEGYDSIIISSIDFNLFCPRVLIFENKHMKKSVYLKCLKTLSSYYGTILENYKGDTICY